MSQPTPTELAAQEAPLAAQEAPPAAQEPRRTPRRTPRTCEEDNCKETEDLERCGKCLGKFCYEHTVMCCSCEERLCANCKNEELLCCGNSSNDESIEHYEVDFFCENCRDKSDWFRENCHDEEDFDDLCEYMQNH